MPRSSFVCESRTSASSRQLRRAGRVVYDSRKNYCFSARTFHVRGVARLLLVSFVLWAKLQMFFKVALCITSTEGQGMGSTVEGTTSPPPRTRTAEGFVIPQCEEVVTSYRFWVRTHQKFWSEDLGSRKWVSVDGRKSFPHCVMQEALALKSLCERMHYATDPCPRCPHFCFLSLEGDVRAARIQRGGQEFSRNSNIWTGHVSGTSIV